MWNNLSNLGRQLVEEPNASGIFSSFEKAVSTLDSSLDAMQENAENAVRKSVVGQAAFGQINSGLSYLASNLLVIEANDDEASTSGAGSSTAEAKKPIADYAQGDDDGWGGGDDDLLDVSLDDNPSPSTSGTQARTSVPKKSILATAKSPSANAKPSPAGSAPLSSNTRTPDSVAGKTSGSKQRNLGAETYDFFGDVTPRDMILEPIPDSGTTKALKSPSLRKDSDGTGAENEQIKSLELQSGSANKELLERIVQLEAELKAVDAQHADHEKALQTEAVERDGELSRRLEKFVSQASELQATLAEKDAEVDRLQQALKDCVQKSSIELGALEKDYKVAAVANSTCFDSIGTRVRPACSARGLPVSCSQETKLYQIVAAVAHHIPCSSDAKRPFCAQSQFE
eukprot:1178231-Prorocentrum_minimum.AAC.3